MKTIIGFLFLVVILTGCWANPLGIVDETSMQPVEERPSEHKIVGIWSADQQSYDLIKEKKVYRLDILRLTFKPDKSFTASNFPDFVLNGFGDPKDGKLFNGNGTWELEQEQGRWKIKMSFDEAGSKQGGITTWYDLYQRDNSILIWSFVGDPDQADRLLFEKEKQ